MKEKGPAELQTVRQQMGQQAVPYKDVVIPQHAVRPGPETVDGVMIVFANPETPFVNGTLLMEFPAQKVIIHHHLAYVGVHVPMPPIEPRVELLKSYRAKGYAWVMTGHGASMEGSSFFDRSIEYYTTLAKVVAETADPAAAKTRMKAAYPDWAGEALLDLMLPGFFEK